MLMRSDKITLSDDLIGRLFIFSFSFLLIPLICKNVSCYSFFIQKIWNIRGCIQKFPDWLPGAKSANGTALFH